MISRLRSGWWQKDKDVVLTKTMVVGAGQSSGQNYDSKSEGFGFDPQRKEAARILEPEAVTLDDMSLNYTLNVWIFKQG